MNTMNMKQLIRLVVIGGAVAHFAPAACAITAPELANLQQEGGAFRLIDVRSTTRFKMGSIPGAMSVPSAILLEKNFAPLGRVILFGDGLGDIDMDHYVQALNQRPGVQAEELVGGYAAWLDERLVTTAPAGMTRAKPPMISYAKLEALKSPVILVDLRRPGGSRVVKDSSTAGSRDRGTAGVQKGSIDPKPAGGASGAVAVTGQPGEAQTIAPVDERAAGIDCLKDFCSAPGRELRNDLVALRKDFARKNTARSGAGAASRATHQPTPLIVLVDSDSVTAEEECRRLKVAGFNRVVILAGGERALETKGRPGLSRVGGKVFEGGFTGLKEKTPK